MSDLFGNHIVGFSTRWLKYAHVTLNVFKQLGKFVVSKTVPSFIAVSLTC